MSLARPSVAAGSTPLLSVEHVRKEYALATSGFRTGRRLVHAVNDVSFELHPGRTLGLVGESGCGKSTVGRMVVGLLQPTAGRVVVDGAVAATGGRVGPQSRSAVQLVFQDPYSSLNPRRTVGALLSEPLRSLGLGRAERRRRAAELLGQVGLHEEQLDHYPQQFSGGQRQRVGIARALATNPRIIVLDEPVSALDVSVQAQILTLLRDLQRELNLSYLFISHDLAVVQQVCDDVAVMYLGRIVEMGPKREIYTNPRHHYTHALLSAAPRIRRRRSRPGERAVVGGELPDPSNLPAGCAFEPRCAHALADCRSSVPELEGGESMHQFACFQPRAAGAARADLGSAVTTSAVARQ